MKILIKTTKRKRSENGFEFNEEPELICVCEQFPPSEKDCCGNLSSTTSRKLIATIPYGKRYSQCEVTSCPALKGKPTYKEGSYVKERCCCK